MSIWGTWEAAYGSRQDSQVLADEVCQRFKDSTINSIFQDGLHEFLGEFLEAIPACQITSNRISGSMGDGMKLSITHVTTYPMTCRFTMPLQQLRLIPRSGHGQTVLDWSSTISGRGETAHI